MPPRKSSSADGQERPVKRVLVATDRSATAERAVAWATDLASRYDAELLLLQVLPASDEERDPDATTAAEASLRELADQLAGKRGRASVKVHPDPPRAIVEAAEEERADVLVVGNAGMSGRKEFLLGNVPNRVSHSARCSVVIVNTTDVRAEAPPEPEAEGAEGKLIGRAARIAKVAAKHGLEDVRSKGGSARDRAARLRAALEELGPTFAKLGQILSTRPDLLPPEVVEELEHLQDRVPPLTREEVVSVMEQELGVPWEDVFESIDPEPLAAGTIGQVHRAVLETGDRVVVKVQRPTARSEIERDLGLLELFGEKAAGRSGLREVIDIPALVDHLSTSLRRELDFRQEAGNIERMREVLGPYPRLDVPRLYAEFSSSRLLVMEEVQGIPIREAPESDARRDAARQMLEAYYRQVLQVGFFHADPHPGNLMWWNDKVYLLDLGMVGEVAPELRELMILLLLAFWWNDPKFLADVMLMVAGEEHRADLDLEQLEQEFAEYIARFRGGSLKDIRLGPMIEGMMEIAARQGMRLPAALALSGKAFGQMQLAVTELDPSLDPFKVIGSFLLKGLREKVRQTADPQRIFYDAQKLKLRATRLIESVERAMGARPGAKLQVEFIGASSIENAIGSAGRRLALAVTAGSALVAAGSTASHPEVARWVPRALGGVGGVLTAWLAADIARRR